MAPCREPPRATRRIMAGETGGGGEGDREGPSPPGPINSISWVGPGDPIYNENGPFLLLFDCFSAIAIIG